MNTKTIRPVTPIALLRSDWNSLLAMVGGARHYRAIAGPNGHGFRAKARHCEKAVRETADAIIADAKAAADRVERAAIIACLYKLVNSRPGLEFGNYGCVTAYRSEMRSITKDRAIALELLRAVERREGITADRLRDAFRAFSGRLSWDGAKLSYCTGQYYPTEYRAAVCAVLSSALWDYTRDECMPPEGSPRMDGLNKGEWLRRYFRREYGRSIANRFFN